LNITDRYICRNFLRFITVFMNSFTIGDIENLTNIKAHTLRIWEQRYGICSGKRKDSNHRYYDGDDLKQILRVAWLYHNGFKISHIACLTPEEIREKALSTKGDDGGYASHINQMLEASIDFDTETFNKVLENAFKSFGVENCVLEVVFPFLNKLGLFWLTGHVIPAQEHFASAIITQKLLRAIDEIPTAEGGKTNRNVVLFTPVGEHHEIPLLFMQYLLRKNRVPHVYLGADIKLEVLDYYCRHQPASQLYFHIITNLTRLDINEYLQKLSDHFSNKEIFCSGVSLNAVDNPPGNVRILRKSEELRQFANWPIG